MFSEFLDHHPLSGLLIGAIDLGFPPSEDRAAWESISPEDRRELEELIAQYKTVSYPMRLASGFMAFVTDGSRQADEQPYFLRRRKLCAAALAACLSEDEPLGDVVDGLWCVMEETSWVISAHNINPIPGAPAPKERPLPNPEAPYVDLFAAQTAMILSLVQHLLKRRLDGVTPLLCDRIEREIRRRVLKPFMETDDFWWMGVKRQDLNNWTPWILSNVMLSACLLPNEKGELSSLLDRGCRMLDRWLSCVPEDGGCDEGAGYWNMAGGALLDCLELLERITGGKMTFWEAPKVQNILRFPLAAEIGNGWFLNFADCDARPFLSGERLQLAGERLKDEALSALGGRCRGTLSGQLSDTPHFSRLLRMLFHHPAVSSFSFQKQDVWLPDSQVRVVYRDGMTLCCKGGHNGESHNHNDVGSFMLYVDGEPQIVDAGNMTYTAKTFSGDRYSLWNVRSAYHNLPMIGGREQQPGPSFAAGEVRCLKDGLSLSLEKAYGEETGVRSYRRTLTLNEQGLTVEDDLVLNEHTPVSWVLILRNAPAFDGRTMTSGRIQMDVPEGLHYSAEELPVEDARMARSFPGSLWRVVLTAAPASKHNMVWTIKRRNPSA